MNHLKNSNNLALKNKLISHKPISIYDITPSMMNDKFSKIFCSHISAIDHSK